MVEYLYRLYDDQGRLLYVGRAKDIGKRLAQHNRTKFWWPQVTTIRLAQVPVAEIARVERELIRGLDPIHNKRRYGVKRSSNREAWLGEGVSS